MSESLNQRQGKQPLWLMVAVDDNGVIGNKGKLPWHIPADLAYFKKITQGRPVIMGHGTFKSLGKNPLPGRDNIILSRQKVVYRCANCWTASSSKEALQIAERLSDDVPVVIGGASIYELFLPLVDKLYITEVKGIHEGDVMLPPINYAQWELVSRDDSHPECRFLVYDRTQSKMMTESNLKTQPKKPPTLPWSKALPPNKEVAYDHVIGETPLGIFLITWKGWKESPDYAIDQTPFGGYLGTGFDLADAKERCELVFYDAMVKGLDFLATRSGFKGFNNPYPCTIEEHLNDEQDGAAGVKKRDRPDSSLDYFLALQDLAIWMTGCGYDFTQHAFWMDSKYLLTMKPPSVTVASGEAGKGQPDHGHS